MLIAYFVDLACYTGMIKLELGFLKDIINIPLIIYALHYYAHNYKKHSKVQKFIELGWCLFIFYFSIQLLNQPSGRLYSSKVSFILNIREIYPYLIFFYTIAVLNNYKKIKITWKVLLVYSIAGTVLTIYQSIISRGLLTDSHFYDVGHWRQGVEYILPSVQRVLLACLYLIEFMFLYYIVKMNNGNIKKYLLVTAVLSIPIILGFARSHWISLILCITILSVIVTREKSKTKKILKIVLSTAIVVLVVYALLIYINPSLIQKIQDRFILTFRDFSNDSGSYGSRLLTMVNGLKLWQNNILFGNGPYFSIVARMPYLTDVGFLYVLVTIGLAGLALFFILVVSNIYYGYRTFKNGLKCGNNDLVIGGLLLLITFIHNIIIQQYTQMYFTVSILAFVSGYTVALNKLHDLNTKQMNNAG